jgi:ubiquinone/menaquinone biosynthesis C-methylase UbiE
MNIKNKIITVLILIIISSVLTAESRDEWQQPEKIMDVIGVKPGMVIGEPGAGGGYFTFKLAKRIGPKGRIYANDISKKSLKKIEEKCKEERIENIITILGQTEDPLLPKKQMDMVIMVYVFHDLSSPVPFLNNLKKSLKPGATMVFVERDPEKTTSNYEKNHFYKREKIIRLTGEAGFKLVRIETFLKYDNIYIFRAIL